MIFRTWPVINQLNHFKCAIFQTCTLQFLLPQICLHYLQHHYPLLKSKMKKKKENKLRTNFLQKYNLHDRKQYGEIAEIQNINPDDYVPLYVIGYGAFGSVLKYQHKQTGFGVAVKVCDFCNLHFIKKSIPFYPKQVVSEYMSLNRSRSKYIIELYGIFSR